MLLRVLATGSIVAIAVSITEAQEWAKQAIMNEPRIESNGGRSLTKDLIFFLSFVFQVVVLFVFFWQKRQSVRRILVGHNFQTDEEDEPSTAQLEQTNPESSQTSSSAAAPIDNVEIPAKADNASNEKLATDDNAEKAQESLSTETRPTEDTASSTNKAVETVTSSPAANITEEQKDTASKCEPDDTTSESEKRSDNDVIKSPRAQDKSYETDAIKTPTNKSKTTKSIFDIFGDSIGSAQKSPEPPRQPSKPGKRGVKGIDLAALAAQLAEEEPVSESKSEPKSGKSEPEPEPEPESKKAENESESEKREPDTPVESSKEEKNTAVDADSLLGKLNSMAPESESDSSSSESSSDGEDSENKEDDDEDDFSVDANDLLSKLNSFENPAANEDKNDLLAALERLSSPRKGGDNSGSSSDSDFDSESEGDSESETDTPSNLIVGFGAAEDANEHGLRRAKKKVPMGKYGTKAVYQMEDEWYAAYPFDGSMDKALFCVFDGHAGRQAAEAAKQVFPKVWARYTREGHDSDVTELFIKAFLEVDEEMKDCEDYGTTATVVYIWRNGNTRYLQAANVGDSTAILYNYDETHTVLTVDHRPTLPSEIERLKAMGVELNPGQTRLNGLAVSRALGDHFPKSVECGIVATPDVSQPIALTSNHALLIVASDGVWDVISPQRAYEIASAEKDTTAAAKRLIKAAVGNNKCNDNVTAIVVRL